MSAWHLEMSPRRWDQLEAKMKAEKENGVPAKSAAPKAEPDEPEGKTLEQVMEESVGPEVLDVKCFGPNYKARKSYRNRADCMADWLPHIFLYMIVYVILTHLPLYPMSCKPYIENVKPLVFVASSGRSSTDGW